MVMNPSSLRAVPLVTLALVLLSGCGDVRRQMGFDKPAPDEFAVVSRAPLSVPPEYSLRPPMPGATRPQEGATSEQARQTILGGKAPLKAIQPMARGGRSAGEMVVLKKAGGDEITADIRRLVNEESTALAEADKTFTDKLMFWGKPAEYHEALDATKENQRIRESQALGKSAGDGETPRIERRRRGILEGLVR
ncbi:MAG: DUF3035 domain-containing protein [Rhodospirillales bacterium]|nr:DUF3035 domain-containing protein [Rhodospirillales bacterium]